MEQQQQLAKELRLLAQINLRYAAACEACFADTGRGSAGYMAKLHRDAAEIKLARAARMESGAG